MLTLYGIQKLFVMGVHLQLIINKTIILPTVYTSMKERGNNGEIEKLRVFSPTNTG
jgi:hypothetical protein